MCFQPTVSTHLSAAHLPSRGDGSLRRSARIRVWQGASVMANNSSRSIIVRSESVEELFDALSALPPLIHCRKCGTELLHVDATFFSSSGNVWTLPLPFCSNCAREEQGGEICRLAPGLTSLSIRPAVLWRSDGR